ncbi:hypothetical protein NW768_002502 [Fusarium equiseti]|uniref:Uncharacterized protein n=1 Tax=Fusarium equiseti TaxID=61235 RepID=A0ABQ8RNK3_FUSEQ|nr:hypothetical protein NW768_002502 [Fusarium equiseti]
MRESAKGELKSFIDNIPAIRLVNFPPSAASNPVHSDMNFRLDMQGITSAGEFNLQVQVNRQTKNKSLRAAASQTVAGPVLVSPYYPMTAEEVREELHLILEATIQGFVSRLH